VKQVINFNGRPDGLGNRIEELINLECYCMKHNISCNYYWNNKYNFRSYDALLVCKNIKIQNETPHDNQDKDPICKFHKYDSQEMINASKNIQYIKNISTDISYISIHIRSTDKLNNRCKDEFSYDLLIKNLNKTLAYLNDIKTEQYIFIASDDDKYKNYLISNLNKNFKIIDPFSNLINNPVYKDYFSLVNSKKIIMVPKFSSFAATASLLGNTILVSHFAENETSLYRYKCNLEYIQT